MKPKKKVIYNSMDDIEKDPSLRVSRFHSLLIVGCFAILLMVTQAMAF